jgi:hypothetical protein
MKIGLVLSIVAASFLAPVAWSQSTKIVGYRIAGDQVVFEFSPNAYTRVTDHHTGKTTNLTAMPIHSVQVAGTFNRWQMEDAAFKLIPTGQQTYALRIGLSRLALRSGATAEFKFLVNQRWWVEPPDNAANTRSTGLVNKSTNFTITGR